jgi:Flp pilus assembly protein TadG
MNLFRNNGGATVVEFALVALPVFLLMFGIMQLAWTIWADNLLHLSVDAAARCGAVNSTISPCAGNSPSEMEQTANAIFAPLTAVSSQPPQWSANVCSTPGSVGLIGTYTVHFLSAISALAPLNLTLTAKSCYPTVVVPP